MSTPGDEIRQKAVDFWNARGTPSATPETDYAVYQLAYCGAPAYVVPDLCRRLEAERDALRAQLEHNGKPAAIVWEFKDAPDYLRHLSTKGGDEDWIVELPPSYQDYGLPCWVGTMDSCFEPRTYPHPTKPGWTVAIGAHA